MRDKSDVYVEHKFRMRGKEHFRLDMKFVVITTSTEFNWINRENYKRRQIEQLLKLRNACESVKSPDVYMSQNDEQLKLLFQATGENSIWCMRGYDMTFLESPGNDISKFN